LSNSLLHDNVKSSEQLQLTHSSPQWFASIFIIPPSW